MNKITARLIALGSWLLFSGSVLAQTGCPPGYYPIVQGPTGQTVQTCVPEAYTGRGDYDDSGDAATAPAVRWSDRWGAIADDGSGAAGIVASKQSKRDAEKAALDDCESRGGGQCTVRLAYHNQCAAVAASTSKSFTQGSPTQEEAENRALERCNESQDECWIYYSGCSLPERIQ